MAYAAATEVPVEKTKTDIEKLLTQNGADQYLTFSDADRGVIQFRMNNRMIRFVILVPTLEEYKKTPTGQHRNIGAASKVRKQAERSRWRSLLLAIKAKLDSIEIGLVTFDEEFMPHIVLPNNQTVGEYVLPQIEEAYTTQKMPPMLPGLRQLEDM